MTLGESMALLSPSDVGPLRHTRTMRLGVGGSEANVAIGLKRLGIPSAWMGRIGRDEFGALIIRELRAEGVQVAVTYDDAATGLMFKERRTSHASRVIYYRSRSAGSQLNSADLDVDLIQNASVLHVSGITPALGPGPAKAVCDAVTIAQEARVPVSLDINYRAALWTHDEARESLAKLIPQCEIVIATEEEAQIVVNAMPPGKLAAAIADLGPRQVVIKRGVRGSVALIDDTELAVDAIPVVSIDPVGAGDAFAAGYLAELVAGGSAASRLSVANKVGAFAVTVMGDWEGLPRREELELLDDVEAVVR